MVTRPHVIHKCSLGFNVRVLVEYPVVSGKRWIYSKIYQNILCIYLASFLSSIVL